MKPYIVKLSTGYLHVAFAGGFCQFPADFTGETIPDEYIFQPEWNRERVQKWWKEFREEATKND